MSAGLKPTTKINDHGYLFKGAEIGSDRERGSNTVLKHVFLFDFGSTLLVYQQMKIWVWTNIGEKIPT